MFELKIWVCFKYIWNCSSVRKTVPAKHFISFNGNTNRCNMTLASYRCDIDKSKESLKHERQYSKTNAMLAIEVNSRRYITKLSGTTRITKNIEKEREKGSWAHFCRINLKSGRELYGAQRICIENDKFLVESSIIREQLILEANSIAFMTHLADS